MLRNKDVVYPWLLTFTASQLFQRMVLYSTFPFILVVKDVYNKRRAWIESTLNSVHHHFFPCLIHCTIFFPFICILSDLRVRVGQSMDGLLLWADILNHRPCQTYTLQHSPSYSSFVLRLCDCFSDQWQFEAHNHHKMFQQMCKKYKGNFWFYLCFYLIYIYMSSFAKIDSQKSCFFIVHSN